MALSNTATRILVSLIAIPLILIVCVYGKIPFLIFVFGIALLSFWEFSQIVKNRNSFPNIFLGVVSIILIISNVYFAYSTFYLLLIIIALSILLVELFRNRESAIANAGTTFLGIFYMGLFSSSIILIREYFVHSDILYPEGGYLIISIMVSIWVCDSAAFFLGSAFGKHKLFPRVSPNKTWEGAIAGFVFAVLTMIVAKATVIDQLTLSSSIIIGVIVGIIGQSGDLVESLVKRDAGVKDSSSIIPGHGGIFDRFDSLLLTAPAVYIYLYLIK